MVQDFWANDAKPPCTDSNQTDTGREVAASNEGNSRSSKQTSLIPFAGWTLTSALVTVLCDTLVYWLGPHSIFLVLFFSLVSVCFASILSIRSYLDANKVNGKIAELYRRVFELEERLKNKPKDETDS